MSKLAKDKIIESISTYPGRSVPLAKTLATLNGEISGEEFDKYIPELLREGRVRLSVDEEDYVRYSPGN